MKTASPLRYPGGKWRLSGFFEGILSLNHKSPPAYIEPYAGGASLALSLLFTEKVSEVFLNDLDPAIHAFWQAALKHTREMTSLVRGTPITPREWEKQREIYLSGRRAGTVALGFSTFFLNRTNHSGILNGGMIGGKDQAGDWKIDARFNRENLIDRIARVGKFKSRIHLLGIDALDLLKRVNDNTSSSSFVYLDPPYFRSGRDLYLNAYAENDHVDVRDAVERLRRDWVVSYDDAPQIGALYERYRRRQITLVHTARAQRIGREVMFFSDKLRIPRSSRAS